MQSAPYIVSRPQPQVVPSRALRVVRNPDLSIETFLRARPRVEATVGELARAYRDEEARARRRTSSAEVR